MTDISSRRRRDERTEETREALLLAAERLFAERGMHAVSNRQISEAAGQGNNAAVTYHFGTKEVLVRAIVRRHAALTDQIRTRLVAEVGDEDSLREWVSVAVRSVTEHLAGLEQPSWHARFMAQVAADPAFHDLDPDDPAASPSLRRLQDGMRRCLPALPPNVIAARGATTRHVIDQAMVDRERQLADRPADAAPQWAAWTEGLIDTVVAMWNAPVTAEDPAPQSLLPNADMLDYARGIREGFGRFMMEYQFAVDEVLTKVTILREEFRHLHRYNPIEHVSSRIKTPDSILEKVVRRQVSPTLPKIREHITDIAGIRITCSFIADTYRMLDALTSQHDIRVIEVKDYIANPKPNGYKSLHAIIEVPVFLSTGAVPVIVEVQIRTVAQDFWASLEHKIFYKYDGEVPAHIATDLADAATAAEQLDRRMEQLHAEVHGPTPADDTRPTIPQLDNALLLRLWDLAQTTGATPHQKRP